MEFVIGLTKNFEKYGFDTTNFRKNVDGSQVILHLGYAEKLIPDVKNNKDFKIYGSPTVKLTKLLLSSEWNIKEEEYL